MLMDAEIRDPSGNPLENLKVTSAGPNNPGFEPPRRVLRSFGDQDAYGVGRVADRVVRAHPEPNETERVPNRPAAEITNRLGRLGRSPRLRHRRESRFKLVPDILNGPLHVLYRKMEACHGSWSHRSGGDVRPKPFVLQHLGVEHVLHPPRVDRVSVDAVVVNTMVVERQDLRDDKNVVLKEKTDIEIPIAEDG